MVQLCSQPGKPDSTVYDCLHRDSLALHAAHSCSIRTQSHRMQGVPQPKHSRLLPPNLRTHSQVEACGTCQACAVKVAGSCCNQPRMIAMFPSSSHLSCRMIVGNNMLSITKTLKQTAGVTHSCPAESLTCVSCPMLRTRGVTRSSYLCETGYTWRADLSRAHLHGIVRGQSHAQPAWVCAWHHPGYMMLFSNAVSYHAITSYTDTSCTWQHDESPCTHLACSSGPANWSASSCSWSTATSAATSLRPGPR
jgi:hypothetical protein